MDKETLENFLSVKGVIGLALLGRKSRPYFYRSFADLERLQQEALQEGLFQVLETMPNGFDFFDFQFAHQRIFVYPIHSDWVLLVGVNDQLVLPLYSEVIKKLRAALVQDTPRGLATFRLLASQMETVSDSGSALPANGAAISTLPPVSSQMGEARASATEPIDKIGLDTIALDKVLQALNHLGQIAMGFLGKAVIVNYWKAARTDILTSAIDGSQLLEAFEVERSGELRYSGSLTQLNTVQVRILRAWVAAFIKRCEGVIRNFRDLLKSGSLSPLEQKLLL